MLTSSFEIVKYAYQEYYQVCYLEVLRLQVMLTRSFEIVNYDHQRFKCQDVCPQKVVRFSDGLLEVLMTSVVLTSSLRSSAKLPMEGLTL
jgi:hypothetical protein